MIKSVFEIENENTIIYDGINEYCMVEHVNEGYFRVSNKKRSSGIRWPKLGAHRTGCTGDSCAANTRV